VESFTSRMAPSNTEARTPQRPSPLPSRLSERAIHIDACGVLTGKILNK
jgi:hypothetical protein